MKTYFTYALLTALAAASLVHCSSTVTVTGNNDVSDDNVSDDDGTNNGSGGSAASTGAGGDVGSGGSTQSGSGGVQFGSGGGGGEDCVETIVEGESPHKPVDIIFVIDKSFGMADAIDSVEQNIYANFAQLILNNSLDYRIIMLTAHGDSNSVGDHELCVGPPLAGTTNCAGPPVNVPGQFYHYSVEVQNFNSLCKVLNTFDGTEPDEFNLAPGGWQQWLRPQAQKVFVEISDANSFCSWNGNFFNSGGSVAQGQQVAVDFDNALLALSPLQFGTAASRNYVFHSLIGLGALNPQMPFEPWTPADPVTTTECSQGGIGPGTGYQWLSKGTRGLRFPMCNPLGYSSILPNIANAIDKDSEISCELAVPDPPMGQQLDLNTLTVLYTPMGNGMPVEFTKVDNAGQCGIDNFYIENNLLHICPVSCATIEADFGAKVEIKIQCPPTSR